MSGGVIIAAMAVIINNAIFLYFISSWKLKISFLASIYMAIGS